MPNDADSQVKRAFNRFMLSAFAGKYATQKDITGWNEEESLNASVKCFQAWIKNRGGVKDQEIKALLGQVRYFFEQHQESRFYDLGLSDIENGKVHNMVGYKELSNGEFLYYVLPQSFREICEGYNLEFAKKTLFSAGWINNTSPKQLGKGPLRGKRVYVFTPKIWTDEDVD